MEWTRNLKRGDSGDDVMEAKQRLLTLGYYADHISTLSRRTFGCDTEKAVQRFQMQAGLPADGIIGRETWDKLFDAVHTPAAMEEKPVAAVVPFEKANQVCALALLRVGDIYVWSESGGKDLSDARIRQKDPQAYARAIRFRDKQYAAGVTGMLSHDCSGFISYLLREAGVWDGRRDCDGLWSRCTEIRRNELIAGDFLFRHESGNPSNKTHVGLYIGRGLVVHCKGRDVGVVLEGINQGGSGYWHMCGRCELLTFDAAIRQKTDGAGCMDRIPASGIV